jgi:hypothetical protein
MHSDRIHYEIEMGNRAPSAIFPRIQNTYDFMQVSTVNCFVNSVFLLDKFHFTKDSLNFRNEIKKEIKNFRSVPVLMQHELNPAGTSENTKPITPVRNTSSRGRPSEL